MPKEALEKLAETTRTQFGKGAAFLAGKMQFQRVPRISTGVFSLDVAIGGGWPRGRMHHIWGPFSSGKTTLTLHSIAQAQKHCHWCSQRLAVCTCGAKDPIATLWIDVEKSFDPEWAQKIGVDLDYLIVGLPDYGELIIDMVDNAMRSGDVGIIVIDSVAAMTFTQQLEKKMEESESPGLLAKMMTRGLRKWTAGMNSRLKHPTQGVPWDNLCSIFLLNQIRDVINSRYPAPPGPPGGRAIRHFMTTEVSVNFGQTDFTWVDTENKGEQEALDQMITFNTIKNKTYPPRKSGTNKIKFNDASIDNEYQVFQHAIRYGLIQVNKSWAVYNDGKKEHKIQGVENMFAYLKKNNQFESVAAAVYIKVRGNADVFTMVEG